MLTALFLILRLEFLNGQYCALYFLIFTFVVFFDVRKCDIESYADYNTPCTNSFSLDSFIKKLELSTNKLLQWFRENHRKANADKCYLVLICNTNITAKVEDFNTKLSMEEKVLGIKFDSKLSFENYVSCLWTKTS